MRNEKGEITFVYVYISPFSFINYHLDYVLDLIYQYCSC